MKNRIVLVGAGSAQFGYGTIGDIMATSALADSTIVLHDINEKTLTTVCETASRFAKENKTPCTVEMELDRKKALEGAGFVIISIEIGDRFALWEQDRTIPQQYGIPQIYGENGGPGGVFHSLRIIPPILDICADVQQVCPDAYVFCYSNPMTAICTAVNRKFPELRFIGLCHEIASLRRYLPDILGKKYEELDIVAGGLNHFSVVLSAKYRKTGKDAYADILKKAPALFAKEPGYSDIWAYIQENGDSIRTEGAEKRAKLKVKQSGKPWADRGLFRVILEQFKLMPVTVDSHFGEYIGWAHDVSDHKGILDFLAFYKYLLSNASPQIKLEVHERVASIMAAIVTGDACREEAVNLPNKELVKELPEFVAVEVPAMIDSDGIHGEALPELPKGFAALLRNYTGVYDLTAEAVIQKSRALALQALLVNPVVTSAARMPELLDEIISVQSRWLGYLT